MTAATRYFVKDQTRVRYLKTHSLGFPWFLLVKNFENIVQCSRYISKAWFFCYTEDFIEPQRNGGWILSAVSCLKFVYDECTCARLETPKTKLSKLQQQLY